MTGRLLKFKTSALASHTWYLDSVDFILFLSGTAYDILTPKLQNFLFGVPHMIHRLCNFKTLLGDPNMIYKFPNLKTFSFEIHT